METKQRVLKRVAEMADSLLTEEYRIMLKVPLPQSYFVKLRHKSNGNLITVVGNYRDGKIRILKNGRQRHEETV